MSAPDAFQTPPTRHVPEPLRKALSGVEESTALDPPRAVLQAVADRLVGAEPVHSALRGEAVGHALHPFLSDFPLGAWISATALDLTRSPQHRPAASFLIGAGLVAVLPVAATGLAEWRTADQRSQRVGVVHSAANSVAVLSYTASLLLRRGGRHRAGVALGLVGAACAGIGGYLGGHLSIVRGIGTADPDLFPGSA